MRALAGVLALLVIGATLGTTPEPSEPTGGLRVVTLNVHQWYAEAPDGAANYDAVRDLLARADADIIALQETEARVTSHPSDPVRRLAWELGMHHDAGAPLGDQVYGVALLSKYPMEVAVVDLPAEESIERIALVADIEVQGRPVRVVATHLQTDIFPEERLRQAAVLTTLTQGDTILLGDLNTEPDPQDPAWALLDAAFRDAWAEGNGTAGHTNGAVDPYRRIDHVLLQGAWGVESAHTVGGPRVSDHLGVVVDLRLG